MPDRTIYRNADEDGDLLEVTEGSGGHVLVATTESFEHSGPATMAWADARELRNALTRHLIAIGVEEAREPLSEHDLAAARSEAYTQGLSDASRDADALGRAQYAEGVEAGRTEAFLDFGQMAEDYAVGVLRIIQRAQP